MRLVFGFRDDGRWLAPRVAHVNNSFSGGPIFRSAFMFLRNSFA